LSVSMMYYGVDFVSVACSLDGLSFEIANNKF